MGARLKLLKVHLCRMPIWRRCCRHCSSSFRLLNFIEKDKVIREVRVASEINFKKLDIVNGSLFFKKTCVVFRYRDTFIDIESCDVVILICTIIINNSFNKLFSSLSARLIFSSLVESLSELNLFSSAPMGQFLYSARRTSCSSTQKGFFLCRRTFEKNFYRSITFS